jgi:ketosteroid isomerase-like protein
LSNNNVDILTRFFDLVLEGEMAAALELIHPECVLNEAAGLPYGGDYIGGEGFLKLWTVIAQDFDLTVTSSQLHDAGEVVVAEMRAALRSKATGQDIDTSIVELYRFTDGQISGIDVYYKDTLAVADLAAAGVGEAARI